MDTKGKVGEFTVWVDGQLVEKKDMFRFPDKETILRKILESIEGEDS